jgi:hypothetical protein
LIEELSQLKLLEHVFATSFHASKVGPLALDSNVEVLSDAVSAVLVLALRLDEEHSHVVELVAHLAFKVGALFAQCEPSVLDGLLFSSLEFERVLSVRLLS